MKTRSQHRHRGGVTPMPLSYFDPQAAMAGSSSEGSDLLRVSNSVVRPRIDGGSRRRNRRRNHRTRRTKGGFVPTVMEGFATAASKYIAPLALMMMYKMINKSTSRRRRTQHRRRV